METATDSKNLTITVCRLVAYLVANIVKDEKEYHDWGFPFIALSVEAQFGKEEGTVILEELNAKFCPLIGHGLSLILEENESEDYTLVHSAEILLSSILNETEKAEVDFDNVLKLYMDNFFHFVLNLRSNDMYDARTRVIARRMCDALNLTASEFSELESLHWRSSTVAGSEEIAISSENLDIEAVDSHSLHRKRFHDKFNHDCKAVPRSSILASFRIWRVAFIAAGGGALMALSGVFAAPAIMNTVLPLICASETIAQVSVALTTALNCIGITSLELIPGIMSSYGAAVAGTKMLHRTAPLRDFSLKPLHLDVSERKVQLQQLTRSASTTHSEDGTNSNSATNMAPALQHSDIDCIDASGKHPTEQEAKGHVPVFILISGHLERGMDARQLWGASGFAQAVVHNTESIVSEVASLLAIHETKQEGVEEGKDNTVPDGQQLDIPATGSSAIPVATATHTSALAVATDSVDKQCEDSGEPLTDWEELTAQVNGWWRENISAGEEYVLQWEPSMLEDLHESLRKILINKMLGKLKGMVKGEILKFTPIPAIRAAATLPLMVMDKINELDDPWVIAMDRAHQAGKLLARVLLAEHRRNRSAQTAATSSSTARTPSLGVSALWNNNNADNNANTAGSGGGMARVMGRPITLVGYGMGARLIFHCLETLAAEGGAEARCIVENAVLIGAPVGMEHNKWRAARSVVAGRLVNCYAWNDWLLALLYRSKSYEIGVAGLYPINLHSSAGLSGAKQTTSAASKPNTIKVATATDADTCTREEVEMQVITAEEHFTAMIKSEDSSVSPTQSTAEESDTAHTPEGKRFVVRPGSNAFEVENCDVSHLISSHTDYPNVLPAIITLLQL